MSEKTATNPEEAHPGIVDIKITKVGLLWRKDAKKRKTCLLYTSDAADETHEV